jgi:hypothetical protein
MNRLTGIDTDINLEMNELEGLYTVGRGVRKYPSRLRHTSELATLQGLDDSKDDAC